MYEILQNMSCGIMLSALILVLCKNVIWHRKKKPNILANSIVINSHQIFNHGHFKVFCHLQTVIVLLWCFLKSESHRKDTIRYTWLPVPLPDSVQFSSVTQSCPTLCTPWIAACQASLVHHYLPEFTQTNVHQVGDAIQPSHPLLSPSPPAPNSSQHQSLFQWVNSSHEVAKVLEFQL